MKFVNLTQHAIHIRNENGVILILPAPAAGVKIPRTEDVRGSSIGADLPPGVGTRWLTQAVWLTKVRRGPAVDLPEPEVGTMFVVSKIVREAAAKRSDLASPGPLVRDEAGRPEGCDGLDVNDWPEL